MSGTEHIPDWRRLFDTIRVPWTDRGPNVGRNRLNIKCPWCGPADPSMHLSIDTTKLVYACQRVKTHTSGHRGGAIKLLHQLGISYQDANRLLDDNASVVSVQSAPTGITQSAAMKQWGRFSPAVEHGKLVAYLRYERGFPDAETVCIRYNLRFAPHGEWAGRLLFPILDDNQQIASWIGRAFYPHIKPKYKVQPVMNEKGLIYTGRTPKRIGIIVEGPMDAMKINAACEHLPVSAVALTGLALSGWGSSSPDRLLRIRNFLQNADTRLIALDSTVPITDVNQIIKPLVAFTPPGYIIRHLPIPAGGSDPGAMSYDEVRQWLTNYLGDGLYGAPRTYSP